MTENHHLVQAQQERIPEAAITAEANAAAVERPPGFDREIQSLLQQAARTNRVGKRIRLVLKAASTWAAPVAARAACRKGCSHCCHIPVSITSAEAMNLAAATGRPMSIPDNAINLTDLTEEPTPVRTDIGPCPFLVEGSCSVYESRPVICRTHFNLDADDLLCRVVPGHPTDVPYADARLILGACLALQQDQVIADIRDFFPSNNSVHQGIPYDPPSSR